VAAVYTKTKGPTILLNAISRLHIRWEFAVYPARVDRRDTAPSSKGP
jgi:hypothetical protein